MKNIMLKITGKTISAHPVKGKPDEKFDDTIEFTTAGQMSSRGGITRITYDETELSGMEGCRTMITIMGPKIKMQRSGKDLPNGTIMEFEKGKRYHGLYETPYGNIGMEILTNSVTFEGENKIAVDYSLSLQGFVESRNELEIEVIG